MRNEPSERKRKTIDECVQDALCENHHAAIGTLLGKNKRWRKNIFSEALMRVVKHNMEAQDLPCEKMDAIVDYLFGFSAVSAEYWNSYRKDAEQNGAYQSQTIKKWVNGEILPPREAVIQLCLCMALTVEESNDLLRAAGYSALYYVDALDIVTMYYLRKNRDEVRLSREQFDEVKRGHQKVLRWMSEQTYGDCPSGNVKPGYLTRVSSHADQSRARVFLKMKETDPDAEPSVTRYVADTVEDHMNSEEEFFDFVEENLEYLGQLHYGLLQRMRDYLETSEYYRKNVYSYFGEFSVEDGGEILKEENREEEIIFDGQKLLDQKTMTAKKNILTTILSLEYKHLDLDTEQMELRSAGSFSDVSTFFDGRKTKDSGTGKVSFRYEHPSKVKLTRMLIAMGREDDIGTVMMQAGYWEKDWIMADDAEQCESLDASDWLIIYMIRYRNCLLEAWAEKQGKEKRTFVNQNRRLFPFHRMVLEISEQVQRAMKKEMSIYDKERIEKYFPVHNGKKDRV